MLPVKGIAYQSHPDIVHDIVPSPRVELGRQASSQAGLSAASPSPWQTDVMDLKGVSDAKWQISIQVPLVWIKMVTLGSYLPAPRDRCSSPDDDIFSYIVRKI